MPAEIHNGHRKRHMSLFSATMLGATCMMGSGWLFSAQLTARYAGNWAFLAWILAAVLVLSVGYCLTRIVKFYPVRGATTRASALSHNGIFGMPFAFANWFGIVAVVTTEAQATTQYLSSAIGSDWLIENQSLTVLGKALAVLILLVYLAVNFYGVHLLTRVNNVVTAIKAVTPMITIAVLLYATAQLGDPTLNFTMSMDTDYGWKSAFGAIVSAGLMYSFNGFQVSVAFASEVKNPERNVPYAILFSVIIALCVYLTLQFAFMAAIPATELEKVGGWEGLHLASPLLDIAVLLGLNFLVVLLLADSVISPSAAGYTYLGASTRMLTAMAESGQMPRWLSKINPVHNVSRRSMFVNWILAAILLVNADSWAGLMVIVSGYHVISYMAAPISMGALEPGKRVLGTLVFTMLALAITTLNDYSLQMVNISLTLLVVLYASLHIKNGLIKLLLFTVPFLVFLWCMYFISATWINAIIAAAFYWFITSERYVASCNAYAENHMSDSKP